MVDTPFKRRSKFTDCPSCEGRGTVRADRSGDWQRSPDKFRPDQLVRCPACGGTGLTPRPGSFDEV